jgi:hypothetical protein
MRDKGFDFYRQDIYCQNLFAQYFDISDLPIDERFEALTAFEVFEHLVDPVLEIEKMLSLSDVIIFSTQLQPSRNPTPETWWYFVPEAGQHVSLYSMKSLEVFAHNNGLYLYTNNSDLHIFSKKEFKTNPFSVKKETRLQRLTQVLRGKKQLKMDSLLMKDFEYVKNKIRD